MRTTIVGFLTLLTLSSGCTTTTPNPNVSRQTPPRTRHRIEAITNALIQITRDGRSDDITFSSRDVSLKYKKNAADAPSKVMLCVSSTVGDTSFIANEPSVFELPDMEGKISLDETIVFLRFAMQTRFRAHGMGDVTMALFEPISPSKTKRKSAFGRQLSNPLTLRIQM